MRMQLGVSVMRMGIKVALGLLMTGTACQLAVDVSDYRFAERDAGGEVSQLEPLPGSDATEEPSEADAEHLAPLDPFVDAGSDAAEAPPGETSEPSEPPQPSNPEPSQPDPPEPTQPDPPEPAEPAPLPPHPMYGCSIIEYCYAHEVQATTDEERCIQQGCTLEQANAECRAEIDLRCGSAPMPPYVMITLAGERVILN